MERETVRIEFALNGHAWDVGVFKLNAADTLAPQGVLMAYGWEQHSHNHQFVKDGEQFNLYVSRDVEDYDGEVGTVADFIDAVCEWARNPTDRSLPI